MPGNGCRGGHFRADEVGAATFALAALEVAVTGAGAALAGLEDVRVHSEAHRAAGLTPFETGVLENAVEPLLLRLGFDHRGTGHHHRADGSCNLLPGRDARGRAEVFDAA